MPIRTPQWLPRCLLPGPCSEGLQWVSECESHPHCFTSKGTGCFALLQHSFLLGVCHWHFLKTSFQNACFHTQRTQVHIHSFPRQALFFTLSWSGSHEFACSKLGTCFLTGDRTVPECTQARAHKYTLPLQFMKGKWVCMPDLCPASGTGLPFCSHQASLCGLLYTECIITWGCSEM